MTARGKKNIVFVQIYFLKYKNIKTKISKCNKNNYTLTYIYFNKATV